jgi:cytoskeleton protein RodZ
MTDGADKAGTGAEEAGADAGPGVGVGEELARARAALGMSVGDVAQQLKFAVRQIEALEQGRFEEIPAGTFARGMVRSYARLLKLDAEPLVDRVAARVAVPDNAAAVAAVRRPIPITDSARRTNLIYAAGSVAVLVVIAAVAFEWQRERSDAARLSFVAAAQSPNVPNAPNVPNVPPEPPRAAAAETAASAVAPPNLSPLAAVAPVSSSAPAQAAEPRPAPARSAVPRADSRPAGDSAGNTKRIVMKFDQASWVQIRSRDGKTLISQLNPAGSEQTVEGQPPFSLIIGNAQYVRLSYEDRQIDLAPHVKVEVARFTLD